MSVGASSHGLLNLFSHNMEGKFNDLFNAIRISIASPEKIRSWSFGEVKRPDTINYRTFKPERDGLFCARIFGPVKDYECLCGKYKRIKYKGIVCEKCGVEVTSSKVRRERMGHIDLACPVAHIWFLRALPSRISTIMGMSLKSVEKVLYFESYIVTDAMLSPLSDGQLLSEEEYEKYKAEYGEGSFVAEMGAEAVYNILSKIDLKQLKTDLREDLSKTNSKPKKEQIIKRLKLVEEFLESDNRPEWMILTVLPVIPPDIRPLVQLDGGRFATSDLNELYRRVINRNNRLKRLMELGAPDIIIKNEKRILQESIDALLDNGRNGIFVKNANKRPFKSLSDTLKGKQGRFRQNLLGKRVDYSGRSVIVVGPELKLHQCGLPKKMALELFKPFIYSKLELYGISPSIKISKKMVESERPEVWDILDEVIKQHPVLLNRAPTLHRLGIQAFEPVLTEGKAIQLHPLVCTAFNADFDGDQMAVHVPLSIEAQVESRVLMMSTNNILSPSSGKPIIFPTEDMVLGLYYITSEDVPADGKAVANISGPAELEHALHNGKISMHDRINYRYKAKDSSELSLVQTTAGRIKLYNILPEYAKTDFSLVNKVIDKKGIANLINEVYRASNQKETVMFCDRVMTLGFTEACKSGISIGKDDMVIPENKKEVIESSIKKVQKFDQQYRDGLISSGERYNKIVDEWIKTTDGLSKELMKNISKEKSPIKASPLFIMADSGARGSETQIKQLAGMRGLMVKSSGEVVETPIISNFKEGLNVLEYFISANGGRKGLVDTALKTAKAGYLTRRLVDVAQDSIVTEDDCGTTEGVTVEATIDDGRVVTPLSEKVLGRVIAEDIKNPADGKTVIKAGTLIEEKDAELIDELDVSYIKVRSVITCNCKNGVCAKCYGRDLATGLLVSIGEAVGVIAAQSIGEPGTQLTMKTKHAGGAASQETEQSNIIASSNGTVKFFNESIVTNRDSEDIVINRNSELAIIGESKNEIHRYRLPYGAKVNFKDNEKVVKGEKLVEWDPYNIPVLADKDGKAEYRDLIENISLRERIDESTGLSTKVVVDWRRSGKKDIKPSIIITNGNETKSEYPLSMGATISVLNESEVQAGDILARIPKESSMHKDITGGLPRVSELFEARKPKNAATMSEVDGIVELVEDYKTKQRVIIKPNDDKLPSVEHTVPRGKHIFVGEGDKVRKGDLLMDGSLVPHDILRILGVEEFIKYMLTEIQKVYIAQGVKINDKHIEIILKMMLKRIEVIESGDTTLLAGEYIDRETLETINEKAIKEKLKPAIAEPVLLGITKSSLQTKSFISAASFQETTKILTNAAIRGTVDKLSGLKESVIIGKLIPAGTGLIVNKLKEAAEKAKEAEEEAKAKNEEEAI